MRIPYFARLKEFVQFADAGFKFVKCISDIFLLLQRRKEYIDFGYIFDFNVYYLCSITKDKN